LFQQLAQFTAMRSVRTLYTALMVLLAKATDRELARMVSYLKEENRILRARLPERINVTPKERERLLRFGRNLGNAVYKVVTIVSPGTRGAEGQAVEARTTTHCRRAASADLAHGS
jgi:hypothetical protein